MRLSRLHPFGGDSPIGSIKIDLRPFRLPKFSRTNENQRGKLQRVITSYSIHYTKLYETVDLRFGMITVQAGGTGHVFEAGREVVDDTDVGQRCAVHVGHGNRIGH